MIDIENAYKQYAKDIYKYVFLNVGGNKDVADDLSSEVFVQAVKSKSTFDINKGTTKMWLIGICRNILKKFYSTRRVNVDLDKIEHTLVSGNNIETNLNLIFMLNKLERQEAELIILKYVYGFSIIEISKITKLSISNTKVRIHRSMQKLRKLLGAKL